jgi:hypothetical protein
MRLKQLAFVGPPIDDFEILTRVPAAIAERLREANGFI